MLEKAIYQVNVSASGKIQGACGEGTDPRVRLIVAFAYILAVLSIPITDPAGLLWMFVFPIVASEYSGIGYGRVFARSLWILPLVALVGVFNPLLDHQTAVKIGTLEIGRGWLTFVSLVLRGLLSFQALLILVDTCGFYDICRALQFFRCPKVLVTQLMMLYRYIGVLLGEALDMQRARQARGYGNNSYPLRMWGVFAGQLLLRSVERARRVHDAMLARGFTGVYVFAPYKSRLRQSDWLYLVTWIAVFAALRFIDFTSILGHLILSR